MEDNREKIKKEILDRYYLLIDIITKKQYYKLNDLYDHHF